MAKANAKAQANPNAKAQANPNANAKAKVKKSLLCRGDFFA